MAADTIPSLAWAESRQGHSSRAIKPRRERRCIISPCPAGRKFLQMRRHTDARRGRKGEPRRGRCSQPRKASCPVADMQADLACRDGIRGETPLRSPSLSRLGATGTPPCSNLNAGSCVSHTPGATVSPARCEVKEVHCSGGWRMMCLLRVLLMSSFNRCSALVCSGKQWSMVAILAVGRFPPRFLMVFVRGYLHETFRFVR